MRKMQRTYCGCLLAAMLFLLPGTRMMAQRGMPGTLPTVDSTGTLPDASVGGRPAGGKTSSLGMPDDLSDSTVRRNLDSIRAHQANVERQKMLTREAAALLQMVAELQLKLAKNSADMPREEMLRQIDTIEKLARSVKDRMKGAR